MEKSELYSDAFYKGQKQGSFGSAQIVVPYILSILPGIESVVDIGCGAGTWLSVFSAFGKTVEGYDFGSGAIKNACISPSRINCADLTKPLKLERKYDLALCLEVAEHIEESCADILIDSLSGAADIILFSAAIPGQKGHNHVNCQWPSYWATKLASQGFAAYDILRPIFWTNSSIKSWYRQNMILYFRSLPTEVKLKFASMASFRCLPLVHPELR